MTSKKHRPLKNLKAGKKHLLVVLLIAIIGVALLVATRASSFSVSLEPENGSKSPIVRTVDDGTASGGRAVQFAGTPPPGGGQECADLTNLKFCEDFDGVAGSYPNSANFGVVDNESNWGVQCFKKNPNNVSLDGQGNLKLTLINTGTFQCTNNWDPSRGSASNITSGYVDTYRAGADNTFKYGKFEIRAKTSCADSVWGALWLSTGRSNNGEVKWPKFGEIDIWEQNMQDPWRFVQTVWVPKIPGETRGDSMKSYVDLPKSGRRWCDDYHVYGVDWRRGSITYIVDGITRRVFTPSDLPSNTRWPFDDTSQNMRLLLDLQLGKAGEWMGKPNLSQLPSSMYIDYVRVYN